MSEVRISAEPRTEFGKGGARRTRRAGKVPAVLYGHGTDPRHISLPTREFERALHTDAGANVLLALSIEGSDELALPKSIQRDPVRGVIEHVDLILVRRGEKITVEVPVHVAGEIDGLEIGASVHAKEIEIPSGTELVTDGDAVVVHILAAPTAEQMEAELDITGAEEPVAAAEEAAGEGDVVPATESGEGGPTEPAADAES